MRAMRTQRVLTRMFSASTPRRGYKFNNVDDRNQGENLQKPKLNLILDLI